LVKSGRGVCGPGSESGAAKAERGWDAGNKTSAAKQTRDKDCVTQVAGIVKTMAQLISGDQLRKAEIEKAKKRETSGRVRGIHVQGSFDPLHRYNVGKHGGFCAFDPLH
jgi:hypothetical protein